MIFCTGCRRLPPEPVSTLNVGDPSVAKQLLYGFYEISDNRWRWTAPLCVVALKPPVFAVADGIPSPRVQLIVNLYFPQPEIDQLGPITLTAGNVCGEFGRCTYKQGGTHVFVADVPRSVLCTNLLPVTLSLDKHLPPSRSDSRDLGMVMNSISLHSAP